MSANLYFIAPLSAMRKRTRLAKIAEFLKDRGVAIRFYGWERERNELERLRWRDPLIDERVILRRGGYATRAARMMYPVWMFAVFCRCLMMPKGAVVWCLGWETAFPARVAGFFRRTTIIFDDADRFSMLIQLPSLLHRMLVRLERWTSKNSRLHLVPGWSRYEFRHSQMMLLRNAPLRKDYEYAAGLVPRSPDGMVTLYVNGWIAWDRGARVVLKALDVLVELGVPVRLLVAGRVASDDGRALIARTEADFRGELPQRDALELYRSCDVALTLYDPAVKINHHAESNKWGDCVFLKVPFIVNSEVETARNFVAKGAALDFPYNDHRALANIIARIYKDPGILDAARRSLEDFVDDYPPFERQLEIIFSSLLCSKEPHGV